LAYFVIRTVLALIDPPWMRWEYVYPPIDAALITVMLSIGDRDPLGNITLMYFLPIAEAAGTLNVVYAAAVGCFCVMGSVVGSYGAVSEKPYNLAFRFVFLFLMSSLLTLLARRAAEFRARLEVT